MNRGLEDTSRWLAMAIFDLGGVSFGDYTIGRATIHSPVYVNPRVLISQPAILRQVARVIQQEVIIGLSRRKPRCSPFDLVAGVPFGGLHLATAFALEASVPLMYALRPSMAARHGGRAIEGRYQPGQTVLIIDDLINTGGSILETAAVLEDVGLKVKDAVALVDRERGGGARLAEAGYHLIPLLRLKAMLTLYRSSNLISDEWFERSMAYLDGNQGAGRAD